MPHPRLFVATPTADGIMLSGFVASLAGLLTSLHAAGIATEYQTLDGTDVTAQREVLAARFLASPCTHIVLTDSDMVFPADLAERLLAFDKPFIGTVYPKRNIDLATLRRHAAGRRFDEALALAYDWNVRFLDGEVRLAAGLCRVEGVGGGFVLVARRVFETLSRRPPSAMTGRYFDEIRVGDNVLDSDYSFCRHWIDAGGEVWAYAGADIGHIGDYRHGAPFSVRLDATTPAARP